jgi:hypothetical protein
VQVRRRAAPAQERWKEQRENKIERGRCHFYLPDRNLAAMGGALGSGVWRAQNFGPIFTRFGGPQIFEVFLNELNKFLRKNLRLFENFE